MIDQDFVLTPIDRPTYKYPDQGSKTNTPPPPPPATPEEEIYWHRGINFCSDCTQKKTIVVDQNKQFWFKEKHKYELIQTYDDDLYKVKKNGLWGIVNYENEEIIPILYDKIDIITNKLTSMVFKEGKTGVYYQNAMVIPVEYEEIKPFYAYDGKDQPAFIAKKDNLYGFLDGKGKVIIPTEYEEIALFYSKYLKLKKNGLYGVAKVNGDMLYEPIYKEIDFEPMLFHGIMKTTNKKDRKKLFALVEENGKTTLRRLKNK